MASAKQIDAAQVEELAASGLRSDAIAKELGISDQTFYNHRKKNPELQAAYERGVERSGGRYHKTAPKHYEQPKDDSPRELVLDAIRRGARMVSEIRVKAKLPHHLTSIALLDLVDEGLVSEKDVDGDTFYFIPPTNGHHEKALEIADPAILETAIEKTGNGISALSRHAMEAALVELTFTQFWHEPSSKCDEVRRLLLGALSHSKPTQG